MVSKPLAEYNCKLNWFFLPVLTGVACYVGKNCGDEPVQLSTAEDCCLRNLSALTSFKTASDPNTCQICLGKYTYQLRTANSIIFFITYTNVVVGFSQASYNLTESSSAHPLTVSVLSPPQSLEEDVVVTMNAVPGTATSRPF